MEWTETEHFKVISGEHSDILHVRSKLILMDVRVKNETDIKLISLFLGTCGRIQFKVVSKKLEKPQHRLSLKEVLLLTDLVLTLHPVIFSE